jgi:hypothetical protein
VHDREDERRAGLQHAMHLAEHTPSVDDVAERASAERDIDRRGRKEGEVREIAVAEFDP